MTHDEQNALIAEQAAEIVRLERDCEVYRNASDKQYTEFREALEMVAKLAHKYRMATPERVAESYPEKRAKALDWLRDKGFCWDCESHDPFGDCMS